MAATGRWVGAVAVTVLAAGVVPLAPSVAAAAGPAGATGTVGATGPVGATGLAGTEGGAQLIFADGFDSGNTLAWSDRQPPLPAPDAYRAGDLDLRDPHVFLDLPGFGCFDFTDTALPLGLGPSFNGQLSTSITSDEDLDGLLDLSLVLGFRPFAPAALQERLDQGMGACSAPLATTVCDWQIPPVPVTTSGYLPAPAQPLAPCIESEEQLLPLELLGAAIDLQDTRLSAEVVAGIELAGFDLAGFDLAGGLLFGFLSEAAADTILLPPELPLVGGQPLSILLPGGTGNCAAGDDRDTHLGQPGWWFYLDFSAEPVPFSGP